MKSTTLHLTIAIPSANATSCAGIIAKLKDIGITIAFYSPVSSTNTRGHYNVGNTLLLGEFDTPGPVMFGVGGSGICGAGGNCAGWNGAGVNGVTVGTDGIGLAVV